jgi:hypothetical protein
MTAPSGLSAFYKSAPICLWVEDEETKTYLSTAWDGDGAIAIGVANGNSQLKALVDSARKDGHRNVFAFRDRDFTEGNREKWSTVDVFASSVLEVENYLLDAEAIADSAVNTSGKTASDIEVDMRAFAQRLDWWMACRATITELRDAVTGDFVKHPKWTKVTGVNEAEDSILKSSWWQGRVAVSNDWSDAHVRGRIAHHHGRFQQMLRNGAWKQEFSGKEIVDHLRQRVWTGPTVIPGRAGKIEFFRAVAERQLAGLPPDVTALQAELHAR